MAAITGSEKAPVVAALKKVRSPTSHPPYHKMISDAITAMKERTGSSQIAITKFIEENNKQLPSNFRKLLLVQLRRLVASGKIVKVKASFKIPSAKPAPGKAVVTKKKTTKPATAPKAVAKPKVVKAKPEAAAAKTVVAPMKKRKAAAAEKVVKVAKKSAKSTPGEKKKKAVNVKKVVAVVVAKKVKKPITNTKEAKNVKSRVKKAAAKKPRSVKL